MTMLDDKTDYRLIKACQKAYLEIEEFTCGYLSCTHEDDLQITQAVNQLRGVVETYFSNENNRSNIEKELSEFYEQKPVYSDYFPWNDLFSREMNLSSGLKLFVSPRGTQVKYRVV